MYNIGVYCLQWMGKKFENILIIEDEKNNNDEGSCSNVINIKNL